MALLITHVILSNLRLIYDVLVENQVPVIVITVPPAAVPLFGLIFVITGVIAV